MDRLVKLLIIVMTICSALVFNAAAMAHEITPAAIPTTFPAHLSAVTAAGQADDLRAVPEDCLEQWTEHDAGGLHDYSCCSDACLDPAWLGDGETRPLPQRDQRFTIVNYKLHSGVPSPPRRPPRSWI